MRVCFSLQEIAPSPARDGFKKHRQGRPGMFESAELGHKVKKSVYEKEVPALRADLLEAQLELAQSARFAVIILITSALQVLLGAIVLVLTSGNATILYFDLRMRKEGFGVTLQRYAEQSAAGAEITDAHFDVQLEQQLAPMAAPGYVR